MSTKEFTIRNYYTRDIPIDDGFDGDGVASGATFPIRIRRFSVAQLQLFQRGFARLTNPTAERFIFRKPEGDEQAQRDDTQKTYVVPQEEIARRRLAEMSAETRAEYEKAGEADDDFMAKFCSEAIRDHVWLPPGVTVKVIQDDDTEFIAKTGADLVTAFGGNLSMLTRLTRAVHQENTLSPEAKKVLRSLSGLTAFSPSSADAAAGGATPAATVASAEAEVSAPSGGASEGPDPIQSGSAELVSTS